MIPITLAKYLHALVLLRDGCLPSSNDYPILLYDPDSLLKSDRLYIVYDSVKELCERVDDVQSYSNVTRSVLKLKGDLNKELRNIAIGLAQRKSKSTLMIADESIPVKYEIIECKEFPEIIDVKLSTHIDMYPNFHFVVVGDDVICEDYKSAIIWQGVLLFQKPLDITSGNPNFFDISSPDLLSIFKLDSYSDVFKLLYDFVNVNRIVTLRSELWFGVNYDVRVIDDKIAFYLLSPQADEPYFIIEPSDENPKHAIQVYLMYALLDMIRDSYSKYESSAFQSLYKEINSNYKLTGDDTITNLKDRLLPRVVHVGVTGSYILSTYNGSTLAYMVVPNYNTHWLVHTGIPENFIDLWQDMFADSIAPSSASLFSEQMKRVAELSDMNIKHFVKWCYDTSLHRFNPDTLEKISLFIKEGIDSIST